MASNKPTPAVKDGLQEEEQLEDTLDRLDQVHVQASLLWQAIRRCAEGVHSGFYF